MKFSLCMIVKNEEAILANCLDSLADIMDEIIIVDTGSTDKTKEIAARYTENIYDYEWQDDFAAARNFAFSKATGDYIYSADADEVLDEENRVKLKALKKVIMPEVEIVQMIYVTEQMNHPTENYARDYRPKLFKRLRNFTWIEPIHETVNVNPVVVDSDIEIQHRPQGDHSKRDFGVFEKLVKEKGALSDRLLGMYLRELYKAGTEEPLANAKSYFERLLSNPEKYDVNTRIREIVAVLMKTYRLFDDAVAMLKLGLREEVTMPNAEICMELGYFFMKKEDYEEAAKWFSHAAFDTESELDIASSGSAALFALALSYRKLVKSPKIKAMPKKEYEEFSIRYLGKAEELERMARHWKPKGLTI